LCYDGEWIRKSHPIIADGIAKPDDYSLEFLPDSKFSYLAQTYELLSRAALGIAVIEVPARSFVRWFLVIAFTIVTVRTGMM